MVIEAEADGFKSPNLKINRPRWSDMLKNYPDNSVKKEEFYPKISKALGRSVDHPAYVNTCALRMSVGLNKSGFLLPPRKDKGSFLVGDDGKNYWLRVADLRPHLYEVFKDPDIAVKLPELTISENYIQEELDARFEFVQNNILDKIKDKTGIIVFEVKGWSNATGHFTLWEGPNRGLLYSTENENNPSSPSYYFWMIPNDNGTETPDDDENGQTIKVVFWELKD